MSEQKKKLLQQIKQTDAKVQADEITKEILTDTFVADDITEQKQSLDDMRDIFSKAHQRNSNLDFEATQNLIEEEEVQAYRKNKKVGY